MFVMDCMNWIVYFDDFSGGDRRKQINFNARNVENVTVENYYLWCPPPPSQKAAEISVETRKTLTREFITRECIFILSELIVAFPNCGHRYSPEAVIYKENKK